MTGLEQENQWSLDRERMKFTKEIRQGSATVMSEVQWVSLPVSNITLGTIIETGILGRCLSPLGYLVTKCSKFTGVTKVREVYGLRLLFRSNSTSDCISAIAILFAVSSTQFTIDITNDL